MSYFFLFLMFQVQRYQTEMFSDASYLEEKALLCFKVLRGGRKMQFIFAFCYTRTMLSAMSGSPFVQTLFTFSDNVSIHCFGNLALHLWAGVQYYRVFGSGCFVETIINVTELA